MIESVRINPERLCRSQFPEFAALHDCMTANKGILDRPFDPELFSRLTICLPKENMIKAPPILLIGHKSAQLNFFSRMGHDLHRARRTPDPELEKTAAQGYYEAYFNSDYHCDHNAVVIESPNGKKYVEYCRLIWTYREHPDGVPLMGFIAKQLNHVLQ